MSGFGRVLAIALALAALGAPSARAQEIDKVLSRVNDNVVTASDVWRARTLKLVPRQGSGPVTGGATTDEAIQRELENRHLMLAEVARFSIPAPTADQLAARRTAWRARFGGADPSPLLEKIGMSAAALDDWLRDDARIDAYLAQQFTQTDPTARATAIANWVDVLRRRAGLPR